MSRQNEWERESTSVYDSATDPHYQYRWSYGEQCAYEQKCDRKRKKRGAVIYAVTLATAFLCCFAILIGVFAVYGDRTPTTAGGTSVADVAEAMLPSTVLIVGSTSSSNHYGSGFFIREDGYIVTNYHVVEGQDALSVLLYGEEQMRRASLVGYSIQDDIAVIKIVGGDYPAVTVGSSAALRVGDVTVAVGNPTGPGGAWTTTSGIVSALDRTVSFTSHGMMIDMKMLQTDAALNSGNSGGPLCNDRGEVIGIVTRKYNDAEGIGLAIPIDGAMPLINAIIQSGGTDGVESTVSRSRPLIGVSAVDVKRGEQFVATVSSTYIPQQKTFVAACDGVAVLSVDTSIPASDGLRVGDVIYAIDGVPCTTVGAMTEILYEYDLGDKAVLSVSRNGEEIAVTCHFVAP